MALVVVVGEVEDEQRRRASSTRRGQGQEQGKRMSTGKHFVSLFSERLEPCTRQRLRDEDREREKVKSRKPSVKSRRRGEVARSPAHRSTPHSHTYQEEEMASLFGGSRASAPAGQIDQARLGEAAMELEAVSDLFTRIVSSCHAKCISTRYAEADLNKGESVCVDRSVPSPPPGGTHTRTS